MRKSLVVFKRITCALGILFIVLGVVPVPAVSVISNVSASSIAQANDASLALPQFSSVNLTDELSTAKAESVILSLPHFTTISLVDSLSQEGGEPPAGGEGGDSGGEGGNTGGEGGDTGGEGGDTGGEGGDTEGGSGEECLEGEECIPVTGLTVGCKSNGTSCGNNSQCCSGNCVSGACASCRPDGNSCSSDGQCCSGDCNNSTHKCVAACVPTWECPTACGYTGGTVTDSCGGTHTCDATEACCKIENARCDSNEECCAGLTCTGHKCKVPAPTCKTEGMPCGGSNICCDGLACYQKPGQENEKCWPACTPTWECPTACGYNGGTVTDNCGGTHTCAATSPCPVPCVLGEYSTCSAECGGGTQTQQILVPAQHGGSCSPDTRACNEQPCPINCEGDWGGCEGECGTTGTQTFHVTVPAQYGGEECEYADGATQTCDTDPCPEDCYGEWGDCVGECGTTGEMTFTILQEAQFGGTECEYADGATQACEMDPCPIDCEWSEWSECVADCGPGTQTREILVEAEWGGLECEGEAEQECYAGDCPSQLVLDPTCVTGSNGNARLAWSFSNPSSKSVPYSWSLDGQTGSGTAAPGATINVGLTTDGPASHTLTVYWPGGSGSSSSSYDCDGGTATTAGGGGGAAAAGIIPVTGGAGGPTEELLIIPVTGVDLSSEFAGFQKLFLYMGLMMFGATLFLEGMTRKLKF